MTNTDTCGTFCETFVKADYMARKLKEQKIRKKITVLLDPRDADRFWAYCEERGFKKSTLIARLVRDHLDSQKFQMLGE